jgi:hypothetical protein
MIARFLAVTADGSKQEHSLPLETAQLVAQGLRWCYDSVVINWPCSAAPTRNRSRQWRVHTSE